MELNIPLALSFDDVLLVPQLSEIASRSLVSTETTLAADLKLQIPVISSNMDTVTMHKMAIAMAQLGGIGFLHRYLTIEQEVAEVAKVKRFRSHIILDPYAIDPEATVESANNMMKKHGVGGLIVSNEEGRVVGILTSRDVYSESNDVFVKDIMTPRDRMIVADPEITSDNARALMHKGRVEKLPLLDENDRCVGLIVIKDIRKLQDFPKSTLDSSGRLAVAASIGVVGDHMERAEELVRAGADAIVIDVAHGHSNHTMAAIKRIKAAFPDVPLIAGNVATAEGVYDLGRAGADAIRCGIGGGSACSTREVAASGLAMISSLYECGKAGKEIGVRIIADGGLKKAADLPKSIGIGSDTAMLGSMLAGSPDAPGAVIERNGQKFKVYRGMASRGAFVSKQMAEGGSDEAVAEYTPEGVESSVPLKDSTAAIIKDLVGGLRSGMSYTGVSSIEEFHNKAKFTRMTSSGQAESRPHVLER